MVLHRWENGTREDHWLLNEPFVLGDKKKNSSRGPHKTTPGKSGNSSKPAGSDGPIVSYLLIGIGITIVLVVGFVLILYCCHCGSEGGPTSSAKPRGGGGKSTKSKKSAKKSAKKSTKKSLKKGKSNKGKSKKSKLVMKSAKSKK